MIELIIKFITDNKLASIFIVLWFATSIKLGYTIYERNELTLEISEVKAKLEKAKTDLAVGKLNVLQLKTDLDKQNNAVDSLKDQSEVLKQQTESELKAIIVTGKQIGRAHV